MSEARALMEREYREDIESLARSIIEQYNAGQIADREALLDHIHETVDGCSRVIYTASAQEALLVSRNDSAGPESMGADAFDYSNGIPWSQLAFFAVEADVIEALDGFIDVNADFEVCATCNKPYTDECDACTVSAAERSE